MRNRASLDPIVWSSFTLLMLVFAVLGFIIAEQYVRDNTQLQEENAVLKRQISEWQRAAMPLIELRGWEQTSIVKNPETFKPDVLSYAIDDCFTTPAGNADHFRKDCRDVESKDRRPPRFKLVYTTR